MSKIFRVEQGNVLRLVMDEPLPDQDYSTYTEYLDYVESYNNRESYPYVADWKVGDLKELNVDFELLKKGIIGDDLNDNLFRIFAYPISKPKKED